MRRVPKRVRARGAGPRLGGLGLQPGEARPPSYLSTARTRVVGIILIYFAPCGRAAAARGVVECKAILLAERACASQRR